MSAEMEARKTAARAVLDDFERDRAQSDHPTDFLSWSVRLANALRGLLGELDDDDDNLGPGRHMPGGGWISGPST